MLAALLGTPLAQAQTPAATTLLGDAGSFRTNLAGVGLSFGLQDTNEVFANVTGGIHTGAAYDGVTMLSVGLDTLAAFGWEGGRVQCQRVEHPRPQPEHGQSAGLADRQRHRGAPTTRLWELFYQQSFLDGRFDVKVGQQSIDQEFITSQNSGIFLNTVMGSPMVLMADLYAGGPAYPLSSLGVRLRARSSDDLTLLGGVFQDNPPGGPFNDDSQLLGTTRWGGNFNLRTGALFIAELQYAVNQSSNEKPTGLPGVYKLGAWFDTASFPSPRFDSAGLPLAAPNSTGVAAQHWHNFSLYGVMDQTVWASPARGR